MRDVTNPEVIKALLEIADAARPVLYWNGRRAEIWLPGLQEKLQKLDDLESVEPPTQTGGTRVVAPDDLIMKISEKIPPEDRVTKKTLEGSEVEGPEEEDPPPVGGSPST